MMYQYKVEVIRVVDGDTLVVDIDLGFQTWIRNITLRLARIDAYETRLSKRTTEVMKLKGLEGKAFLEEYVSSTSDQILVTTTEKEKYGRWIAEVEIAGVNVNDLLVTQGYAVYKTY